MDHKLVKITKFSGEEASVYSIFLIDEGKTLFDIFIEENKYSFLSELKDIFARLTVIGHKTGARISYFKEFEGRFGDHICALYDEPDKTLRLYCIRFGTSLVILGGGGPKLSTVRALQEDEKLTEENYLLRKIAEQIYKRIEEKEIRFIHEYKDLEGNLEFYEDQE